MEAEKIICLSITLWKLFRVHHEPEILFANWVDDVMPTKSHKNVLKNMIRSN